ncbi:5500_t:CDS:10 [Acaulospora morrowiae]|uniref:5500_t:CDS:1 n=1 Tax=Acaulospora morrowiae TaxID=94023 RepID=A0A9N8ZP74_9GLOM|nr:5500_t:CDS:10 [Acaulospora morrowiae]
MSVPSFENFNFDLQAVKVPNSKKPGQSFIYRNATSPDKLYDRPCPEISTLFESFQNALKVSRNERCLGHRPYNKQTGKFEDYVWQSYEEVLQRFTNFGSGLLYLNEHVVKNEKSEKFSIGVWSINRPEYHITEQAISAYNLISVPLYDTLGSAAVEYVLKHAEIKIVIASADHITNLVELSSKTSVKVIISMDPLENYQNLTSEKDVYIYTFDQVENIGRDHPRQFNPPKPEDINTISYTSGTTGLPKGVMLTHGNFAAMLSGLAFTLQGRTDDIIISYLPLAHIFGRACEAQAIFHASAIGYYHGIIDGLLEDVQLLKPTIFPAVPRIFNRIYNLLTESHMNTAGAMVETTRKAIDGKLKLLRNTGKVTHPVYDAVLSKYKKILGGQVRILQSASAPIGLEIKSLLSVIFSAPFIEEYGMTEGTGLATNSIIGDPRASHVGPPFICSEIKLSDVPEMEYTSEDKPYPRGEICVRGPNVMKGYYKDPEKTKEVIDEDGWLHSGDIGTIDSNGCLIVIDRKKNIFKLAQGEYIAPEKIEVVYQRSPLVQQMYVHGDSVRSALVGIAVPHTNAFISWVEKKFPTSGDIQEELKSLANNRKVRNELLKEINDFGRAHGLKGFELVKAIHIELNPFSIVNGILTPTLKLKRPAALNHYKNIIERLYVEYETPGSKL